MKRPDVTRFNPGSLLLPQERRSAVRHRISFPVPCWLADGGPVWKGHLRDISTLGVVMRLPQKPRMGALLEIDLQSVSAGLLRRMTARIVHLEQEDRGWWLAGCAFIRELAADELSLVHAEAIRSKATDQRRWLRFPCNLETTCYPCETTPGSHHRARVVNLSATGIGLLIPCRFAEGGNLQIEFPGGLNQPQRLFLVRVVRVMEQLAGTWFHGCEFGDQLAEDDLRFFQSTNRF